jgi:catechol 2,3-dioxygenase-like lactoylglutathione lyase family enzyme
MRILRYKKYAMQLGAFSVSLSVRDIQASRQFYENLGFSVMGGDITQNWLILKNENAIIGLFQGMFEKNILTFNPGWDQNAQQLTAFEDVRDIQKALREKGISIVAEADETSKGPAHIVVFDPDGNQILIDQHV